MKPNKKLFVWAGWVVMLAVVVISLTIGIVDNNAPQTAGERASSIARTVRCPQCDGETVAESDAPIAKEIRANINLRVSQGETDNQIRNVLADLYGRDILLTPPGEGFGSSVWVIPIVSVSLAVGILALVFWRRRLDITEDIGLTTEDSALVEKELEGNSKKR